ncbi:SVSP family protein [Theileria parva strain Muguga]|uniref:SVSP family protein n=1 Tax=Theileria parva strain Muguga TaxID=333668 RepID=UPI001C61BDF6|nr:SVSP family protein [Theileria parva strain Muguga]EAN33241.2 SVSP family protein [Theileria parva strain Muguga]
MTTEDYEESSPETSISKYVFKSKLEQFYCDDEVIYTRKPEGKYCKCLTYNNISNYFIITSDDGFALFKKFRGK